MSKLRVLLVEDSPSIATLYQEFLYDQGYEITHVDNGKSAIENLKANSPEIVLLDLNLPDIPGIEVLKYIKDNSLNCSVIVITAHGSIDVAVDTMQLGAFDFIVKPLEGSRLRVTVANAAKLYQLSATLSEYKKSFARDSFHGFVGGSHAMQNVYHIIENAAPSTATVFITGESGTGKELCAEAIHRESNRSKGNFVAINCGAIPKDLMESEIFGHVKGAFTGAHTARDGAAARADGGTLFLDEICEMDLELQVKLLRFIQTGTYQKVGGSKLEKVDLRIVCATNRDPLKEVEEGRFREDLYYRLHVLPIHLPPLRERDNDIEKLLNYFLKKSVKEESKEFSEFEPSCLTYLCNYNWPGNIRQLENSVRNMVILNNGKQITLAMIPQQIKQRPSPEPAPDQQEVAQATQPPDQMVSLTEPPSEERSSDEPEVSQTSSSGGSADSREGETKILPMWIEEKRIIEKAIVLCQDNIPKAAAYLEISPSTIYRKKQQWQTENQNANH